MARKPSRPPPATAPHKPPWDLHLYVAGSTPKSLRAIDNLRRFCESELHGEYRITIVDLLDCPELASADQIVAIPTLVRKLPLPIRKVIGDLSTPERVLLGLEVRPTDRNDQHSGTGG